MMDFIFGQCLFFVALFFVLGLPGWAWVCFLERKKRFLTLVERIALTITLSIVVVDFLMIILGRIGIPLMAFSVGMGIFLVSGVVLAVSKKRFYPSVLETRHLPSDSGGNKEGGQKMSFLFLLVFSLAVGIKMLYFVPNIVPSSTDLGHHSFWVQKIVSEQRLPIYEERDIVTESNGDFTIGDPEPISDFIIGEHLVLSAVAMLSEKPIVSGFAMMTLFVIHIATLFAMYALARRMFEKKSYAENVAVWTLFFFGVLYALGQSQMRYVTGGAVGNVFGNLFIPMAFLMVLLALRYKSAGRAVVAMGIVFALVYTHHLSTLIFIVVLVGFLGVSVFIRREMFTQSIFPILKNRWVIGTIVLCGSFLSFFYVPSYISNMAVGQVVGAPKNEEHLGFSFLQLARSVGESRMTLGLLGVGLLLFFRSTRRSEEMAILFSWVGVLSLLVLFPNVLRIDLPSARVANFLVFPLSILSGFAIVSLMRLLRRYARFSFRMNLVVVFFMVIVFSYGGFLDNDIFMKPRASQTERSLSVFSVGKYTAEHIPAADTVMHDHINIPGDSWIKLFFNRDYNYPFYRALLFRYERATDKQEKCTLYVISEPNSKEAKKCQEDLNIRAVIVDEKMDGQQFEHFREYDKVYNDAFHSVYVRGRNNSKVESY